MEIILNFNIHFGYFAVAEMREISQSFEDGGMPGTIGRCYWSKLGKCLQYCSTMYDSFHLFTMEVGQCRLKPITMSS